MGSTIQPTRRDFLLHHQHSTVHSNQTQDAPGGLRISSHGVRGWKKAGFHLATNAISPSRQGIGRRRKASASADSPAAAVVGAAPSCLSTARHEGFGGGGRGIREAVFFEASRAVFFSTASPLMVEHRPERKAMKKERFQVSKHITLAAAACVVAASPLGILSGGGSTRRSAADISLPHCRNSRCATLRSAQ